MKLLDEYNKLELELHKYFGYQEDWVIIPMMDSTDYYWYLDQNSAGWGEVRFAETLPALMAEEGGEYYCEAIYTQRFLKKWVYEGEDFTMISCDTQTDGNKFLRIFDNSKRVNEILEP